MAGAIAARMRRGRSAAGWFGGTFLITGRRRLSFIICFVKTRTFKNHARTAPNQTCQFIFMAFGAFFQFSICHALQFLKGMSAGLAFIFIGWHKIPYLNAFLNLSFNEALPLFSPNSLLNCSNNSRWRELKLLGTLIITRTYRSPCS